MRTISSTDSREQRQKSETRRGTLSTSRRWGRTASMPRGSFSRGAAASWSSSSRSPRSMQEFQSVSTPSSYPNAFVRRTSSRDKWTKRTPAFTMSSTMSGASTRARSTAPARPMKTCPRSSLRNAACRRDAWSAASDPERRSRGDSSEASRCRFGESTEPRARGESTTPASKCSSAGLQQLHRADISSAAALPSAAKSPPLMVSDVRTIPSSSA
mmetsp:Transcript_1399/g.3605  ORF Transcript_1399/g.3605 Transcript_1399/m.3605 type:complete len:214 (-) Transcript_1399:370-1011(-)